MIVSPPPPAGLSGYLRGRRQGSPSLAIKYFLHSDICRIALRNERSWDLTDAALSWNMSSWYCYHKRVHSVQCSQHQEPPGRLEYRCSDQQVQQASAEQCRSRRTLVNRSPRGQLGQFPAPHFSWTLPVLFLDQGPSILILKVTCLCQSCPRHCWGQTRQEAPWGHLLRSTLPRCSGQQWGPS